MLKITIKTTNAATVNAPDLAELVREVARQIDNGAHGRKIIDYNGNEVGSWSY